MNSIQIRLSDSDQDPWLFEKNFWTPHGFHEVKEACNVGRTIGMVEAWLYPVRTLDLENFCKDLFLPSFFNQVLKTNDLYVKILIAIPLLIVDIITLPLRLIVALPKCIYDRGPGLKEYHPLHHYLTTEYLSGNRTESILQLRKKDYVWVKLQYRQDNNIVTIEKYVHFISLPENAFPRQGTHGQGTRGIEQSLV